MIFVHLSNIIKLFYSSYSIYLKYYSINRVQLEACENSHVFLFKDIACDGHIRFCWFVPCHDASVTGNSANYWRCRLSR